MCILIDQAHKGFPETPLNWNAVVDAIGPETDLTIKKDWKNGHQVFNK